MRGRGGTPPTKEISAKRASTLFKAGLPRPEAMVKAKSLWGRGFTGRGELTMLSFRGALRAEESLFSCAKNQREIPHFVRNDKKRPFCRILI